MARGKKKEEGSQTQSGRDLHQHLHALGIPRVQREGPFTTISYPVAHLSRAVDRWLLGVLPGTRACGHSEIPGQRSATPTSASTQAACLVPLLEVSGMMRGNGALSTLPAELGIAVGRTGQPPLPPALPAPSLAGGRQLCGCSAHLPPPESPALKLPGCGQPRCHGNCILHPCRSLHLKAIGENRGTGKTEEGEKTVAWLRIPPSLPSPPLLAAPHTGNAAARACSRAPGGTASCQRPPGPTLTTWRPLALSVEGGTKLIKISLTAQPQIILTHAGSCQNSDLGAEVKGQEEGKGTNLQPRPTGMGRAHRRPCSLSWETCLCALLTEQQ